jgi:transposase
MVDRLLDAGVRVLPLHPNQVKAARGRFRASGGKSDRFDRFVLCELARTDAHRFRVLEPDSDETKAIRALTRAREDLVMARVALTNQLRAELERCWPGPIGLFSALDSRISLAFLQRYPSPQDAQGLSVPTPTTRSGVPGFDFPIWYGIWAPPGTPAGVVLKLAEDIARCV